MKITITKKKVGYTVSGLVLAWLAYDQYKYNKEGGKGIKVWRMLTDPNYWVPGNNG